MRSPGSAWTGVLALFLTGSLSSCTPSTPPRAPAPKNHPAVEQIPADLDVVVRADLNRIRDVLDPALADVLARLLVSQARAPEEIVVAALATTDKLWLGFRPQADPRNWDNVVILEGDYSGISTEELSRVFGPPRDLGGGFRAYDDPEPGARTAPARLYTHLEDKWILASEAEIDAIERVVERHHYERALEPPERGVVSLAADLSHVAPGLTDEAPRAAELLATARAVTGSISLDQELAQADLRLELGTSEDANAVGAALRLFLRIIEVDGLEATIESEGKHLLISVKTRLERLEHWVAAAAR